MTTGEKKRPGQVWAHVGQPFSEEEYGAVVLGAVVLGAGLLGTAAAVQLREQAPDLRVLLLDEGGLPNEEGATLLGAGVWDGAGLSGEAARLADQTRQELERWLGEDALTRRPLLDFGAEGAGDSAAVLQDSPALAGWVDPGKLPRVEQREALLYRPGELTLRLGRAAVAQGADLMLNVRAEPVPGGVRLHRLSVTNRHEIIIHETKTVRTRHLIVAAGAAGPDLLEHSLGLHTPHGRAYVQRPRLRQPSDDTSPVLRAGDLLLRPLTGEYALYLPPTGADPHGYQPTSGRLTGVQVGLRRELLRDLLPRMEALPVLATEALGVGRSLADLESAWLGLPYSDPLHPPVAEQVAEGLWLLLGGSATRSGVDTLGLGLVQEMVQQLAGTL
ncbi:FAD-dependent oxidoreductase [Deinococcus sp. Marseille-Q6407]|uniref:FAD-dependent oxidoreductase n=1 Tax=Deinococcus sp. Marseille-Q6407 TaxID=2969223 RepID=UPI0021C1CA60|nr:FAD-dependent oxidoreductase [Deinococcus sp. Marseille-Q6407]